LESRAKTFSVIIPTYRRAKELDRLLSDIEEQNLENLREEVEVIVVTENPDENVRRVVEKHAGRGILEIVPIFSEGRLGLPGARNRGVEIAKGKFVIFMDDDLRVGRDFLSMCQRMAVLENFCFRIDGARGIIVEKFLPGKVILPLGLISGGFWFDFGGIVEVSHLPGACFVVNRECLEMVKFDEKLGEGNAYLEDCDFSFRLRRAGRRLYYISTYSVKHVPPEAGGCRERDYRRWLIYYWSHRAYFVRKNGGNKFLLPAFLTAFLECMFLSISRGEIFLGELFVGFRRGIKGKLGNFE
jgi:GT2 family glycosyltransferase